MIKILWNCRDNLIDELINREERDCPSQMSIIKILLVRMLKFVLLFESPYTRPIFTQDVTEDEIPF